MIRRARIGDAKHIQDLVNSHAEKGEMLPRSLADVCDSIRDFLIYEENGAMLGCCALHVTWIDLAEIRSLVVVDQAQRSGVGSKLVDGCLDDAEKLGIRKVFALTYKPGFFEKKGFRIVDKSELPHKVWLDCVKCVKFPDCDEIAVAREL